MSKTIRTSGTGGPLQNIPKPEGKDGKAMMVELSKTGQVIDIKPLAPATDDKGRISRLDNTLWELTGASLLAFIGLLEAREIDHEINFSSDSPVSLTITWSRYAMDEYGYHVGYENYRAVCPIFPSVLFGGRIRLPHDFDPWCLFPAMFEITITDVPEDRDGYMPPDEDFAQQEFDNMLRQWDNDLPVATFDPKTATWELAGREWKVGTPRLAYL